MTDLRTLAEAFDELERRADRHDESAHLVVATRQRRVSTHRLALAATSIGLVLLVTAGAVLLGRGERHSAPDAGGPTAGPSSSAPGGSSAQLRAALWQAAETLGRENGDARIQAQAVLTRAGAAQKIDLGSPTESQLDRPVWIIQITGNFSCGSCSAPAGVAEPMGTVMDLVLDAASPSLGGSGQPAADLVSGFSIGGHPVDLAALGPVVTLSAPPSAAAVPGTPTPSPTGTVAVLSNDAVDALADLKAGLSQSQLGVEVVRQPGQRLDVVLSGSSTCMPSVVSATQTASDAVTVAVHPCTGGGLADLKTSDTVATFARLGDDHPVRVTVIIPAQGSAAWTLPAVG